MSVLYRIRTAMSRFMYGRNGMDQCNRDLLWAYFACFLLQAVFGGLLRIALLSAVFEVLMWLLFAWILFRMFSKNLPRRQLENQKWINLRWRVKNSVSGARARHADKAHKYFTCKSCGAICRVPVGKGSIVITCPKCGTTRKAKT
ncbi:MAG: hypothetical protein IJ221_07085 [Oscillibacter sp.]|nr:hypothetical protein [Oscillibacter sp.]